MGKKIELGAMSEMIEYRIAGPGGTALNDTPMEMMTRIGEGLSSLGLAGAEFNGTLEVRLGVPPDQAELVEEAASRAGVVLHRIESAVAS